MSVEKKIEFHLLTSAWIIVYNEFEFISVVKWTCLIIVLVKIAAPKFGPIHSVQKNIVMLWLSI